MDRPSMSRFTAGAGYLSIWLAAMYGVALSKVEAKDGPGGHPLAGRHGGLADLLEAADWPAAPRAMNRSVADGSDHEWAPKEASVPGVAEGPLSDRPRVNPQPVVKPAAPDRNAGRVIEGLIDQRNQIVDRCDFFQTVETIKREEWELAKRVQVNLEAAKFANAAAFALQQVLALGEKGQQLQPAARERVQNAQNDLRTAIGKVEEQQRKLKPLYEKIQVNVGPLMQAYQELRSWLVPDRQDPNRPAVLAALDAATKRRDDFYEGHVLAAIAQAYDGDAANAGQHLTAACAGFGRYGLFGTSWGADCCLAYLLLDQPKKVADYVASVRKLDSKRQTPLLCWLVGQAAMLEEKDNEAKTYFGRALTKMGLNDPKQPSMPEPLLGDAAFFYATAKNDKVRDLGKAKELLARAPEGSTSWQVLKARAAVLAAEGDSEAARQAFDDCRERAPGTLDARLEGILSGSVEETPASER